MTVESLSMAKAINQGLLDQDVSKEDRARMLDFLRTYGPLDDAGNSVRAQKAIADISKALDGNPFSARAER